MKDRQTMSKDPTMAVNNPFWVKLPPTVRDALLVGSEGKIHLMGLAQACMQDLGGAGQMRFRLDLAIDLLISAWAKDPLDGQLAGQLLELNEKWPFLNPDRAEMLRAVVSRWEMPTNLQYYRRLAEQRAFEKMEAYMRKQLAESGDNLYWRQQFLTLAFFENRWEMVTEALGWPWAEALTPCRDSIRMALSVLTGDLDRAADVAARSKGPDAMALRVRQAWTAGRQSQARRLVRQLLNDHPWAVTEILGLHDLLTGVAGKRNTLGGTKAVLLYSFNKAQDLDATLAGVRASDLDGALVRVLDNGSTDGTAEVLRAWAERWGEGDFQVVPLHVNIGAPAARNWLMHLPEVRSCDWVAYLDDDALVPEDWLSRFGAAVAAYPEAGAWGCRVVDAQRPVVLQSVDLHLMAGSKANGEGRRFEVSDLHHQTLDFGQFDYLRPCASVTGCCHLFRGASFHELGGFDLRFSPSQFDDLERDIRMSLGRKPTVYQGHLCVRHMKRTGASALISPLEYGNSMANMYKLQMLHSQEEYDQSMAWERDLLAQDFFRKLGILENLLKEGRGA
ncbi:MAG: glycosyltransferase family 2 protein [Deltaproteobacteria bacterium]|nr:glycosyltransferase family 2 protein [Deltaproteobacteria bacterium]